MTRVRPILRWPGGKSRMVPKLLPKLSPHTCYVEPFAGGVALLLAKARSPVEVINDLNGDLVALYRCAQFHLEALLTELNFLLTSREMLGDFKQQPGLTDLQRAAPFLWRNRSSFQGGGTSFAVSKTLPPITRSALEDRLRALNTRLEGVAVENVSYERIFRLYDSPGTLFFCDPPYLNSSPSAYAGWQPDDMRAFADRLRALQGQWITTVDDSPFNRELFGDCTLETVVSQNCCGNQRTHSGRKFGELIIQPKRGAEAAGVMSITKSAA